MTLRVTITPSSVNMLLDGRMRTIDKTHANFQAVRELIKEYQRTVPYNIRASFFDELKELVDIPLFVARVTEGKVRIGDNKVYYGDTEVHGVIVDRLLTMLGEGFDPAPLARFLDKMMQNPCESTRQDLYTWLEVGKLPLCDDGDFLAFKKVKSDYRSYYDDTTDNSIGSSPKLDPSQCDPDRYNECSAGLHFCSYNYLSQYYGSEGRVVIVKINPANVVAIPHDYGCTKGRAWTYDIIGEVPEDEAKQFFTDSVVASFGTYEGTPSSDESAASDHVVNGEAEQSIAQVETVQVLPKEIWSIERLRQVVDSDLSIRDRRVALINAFLWKSSPQGTCYWDDIYERFSNCGLPGEAEVIIKSWITQLETNPIDKNTDEDSGTEPLHFSFVDRNNKEVTLSSDRLLGMITKNGQRGTARILGVPRTTLQGWLAKITK